MTLTQRFRSILACLPAVLVLMGVAAAPAAAQPPAPPAPVQQPQDLAVVPNSPAGHKLAWALSLFRGTDPGDLSDHFTEQFLKQVPPQSFLAFLNQMRTTQFADDSIRLERIERDDQHAIVAVVSGGEPRRLYSLFVAVHDESGKVSGLLVQPFQAPASPAPGNWEQLEERLGAYGSGLAVGVYRLKEARNPGDRDLLVPVYEKNEELPLAIGSAFKLYVLGALGAAVQAGEAGWDELLAIDDARKSLPSGKMQNEAAGAEFPLTQFANLMISISDNTATDHLIHRVGREKVEAYMASVHSAPGLNQPFLTTRELFVFKLSADQDMVRRYIDAPEPERRTMLAPGGPVAQAEPNIGAAATWVLPRYIGELEWFASVTDLCTVMADLKNLEKVEGLAPLGEALRINPGIPFDRQTWTSIGFKGGSEPGVINLTWLLERNDGVWFTVSLTINDPRKGIDQDRAIEVARAVIDLAAQEPAEAVAPGGPDGN